MFAEAFYEITAVLAIAAALGAVGSKLRQPLIVSFIAAGILVGPSGIAIVSSHDQIALLAEIGIALLLFVVGLKLDLHMARTMGKVALATGLGQVAFTSIFGFLIALMLGMGAVEGLYVAVALTFSSTIIVVKLLSDKKELDSLHGRIAIGFLIVQDVVVVLAMIALSALGQGVEGTAVWQQLLFVAFKGIAFVVAVAFAVRFVLPWLLTTLARSQELLGLFAISWAVLLAAAGDSLGFSKEVGAFVAGVSLATSAYRESITTRLTSVRDFLLLFFFIDLGSRIDLGLIGAQVPGALVFSVFVLVGNPLIVMAIMGAMGYRKRTGFLAGLTVAQISEFSLILIALGMSLGHVRPETVGLVTLVGLITIALSTYLILYSGPLYQRLSTALGIFERRAARREDEDSSITEAPIDVILFGLGRYGGSIARQLLIRKKRVIGVDFDPDVLEHWRRQGMPVLYGDIDDPDIFEHLPLSRARWVVDAARRPASSLALLRFLRERDFQGKIVLTALAEEEASEYLEAGADVVLRPFVDAAEQAVDTLTSAMEVLSENLPWPVTLREVLLPTGSTFTGRAIGELPLRTDLRVSILAVTRAGATRFDPSPDSRLYPGDRVVLLGEPSDLARAVQFFEDREPLSTDGGAFSVASIAVPPDSPWAGRTLADLDFRQRHRATIIGIQRGEERILSPMATDRLQPGDVLVVAGERTTVDAMTS